VGFILLFFMFTLLCVCQPFVKRIYHDANKMVSLCPCRHMLTDLYFLCPRAEKDVAVQALQQQLDELTASHEAAIEAMKTTHCEEMESLKNALSSQISPDAFETRTASATNEPASSMQSNSVSGEGQDVGLTTCGFCQGSLSAAPRNVRELAALYDNERQRAHFLQSKLNTVTEFITYVDNLDESTGTVNLHLSDELCKDDSDVNTVNSRANVLAAARAFAVSFRQAVSDFPLQVENLQRTGKFSSHCMQLSVLQEGDEVVTSAEQSYENMRPTCPEITSMSVAAVDDGEQRNDNRSPDPEVIKLTESFTIELETKNSEIAALTQTIDSLKEMLSSQHDELSSAVRSKDEIICSAKEKHRSEVAAVTEKFENKISDLESEHRRSVEEYHRRIAEMEQSDIELNTQLIAVTEKFNSVTEYMAGAERVIEEYRLKADKWSAERDDYMKATETACAELSKREAEIVELKEQIRLLKPSPDVRGTPVSNVELEVVDLVNSGNCEPPLISNAIQSSLPKLNGEISSPENTRPENDTANPQQENLNLTQQPYLQHRETSASLKEHHSQIIEQMRLEHHAAIQDLEEQHNSKVVQLIKDFSVQMATHEKELQESMNSDYGW